MNISFFKKIIQSLAIPNELLSIFKFFLFLIKKKNFILLNVDRIGHLCLNTASLYNILKNNKHVKEKVIVVILNYKFYNIANKKILILIKKKFFKENIQYSESYFLYFLCKLFFRLKEYNRDSKNEVSSKDLPQTYLDKKNRFVKTILTLNENSRIYSKNNKTMFNQEDIAEESIVFLNKIKLIKNEYLCFYSRDGLFLKSNLEKYNYHKYRDSDYSKLIKTVKYFNNKNYKVVRVGRPKLNLDKKFFDENHIDLNHDLYENLNDNIDVIILSNCKFYLGDTSGISTICTIFDKPIARYNWVPIFNTNPYKSLVIPSLIKDIHKNELMPFKKVYEIFEKNKLSMSDTKSYQKLNLEVLNNSEDDILEMSKEINYRIDYKDFNFWDDKQLNFNKFMNNFNIYNFGKISDVFFRKYFDLFF